jgi:uncharacterized protein (DUF58 family)
LSANSILFVFGFFFQFFYYLSWLFFGLICIYLLYEIFLLFSSNGIVASRTIPDRLSNGDENIIQIKIFNKYKFNININIIDELPFQFQNRNYSFNRQIISDSELNFEYILKPTERGEYTFGKLNIYAGVMFGLGKRRFIFENDKTVAVYPSFLKLKYYQMISLNSRITDYGMQEVRKLGNTMEFEHIRDYRNGDDFRNINWKATAKKSNLMVNQYIDERSQNIYCILDLGRTMKMPFDGMTLLDYSINTSLNLSNIILRKYDKPGLIAFDSELRISLPASNHPSQFIKIMELLYKLETNFGESDFEILYSHIRRKISHRSLLVIFTNFEHINAMRRNLKYIKLLSKFHLPLVVFFDNDEIRNMIPKTSEHKFEIYEKVYAEQYILEKYEIINEFKQNGIPAMLSSPENLTMKSINKYLELKSLRQI